MNKPPHPYASPLTRFRDRIFAWMMGAGQNRPAAPTDPVRRALFSDLSGVILEIGPGSGVNLPYYPRGIRWTGVEPNPYLHRYLERAIHALDLPQERFTIDPGDSSSGRLPAADGQVDAVISTYVLCTVPDLAVTLAEVLRVLRPGGRLIFLEHVAAPRESRLRAFQDRIQPTWTWVGAGCHPNRETGDALAQAGFAKIDLTAYKEPEIGPIAPHIRGTAWKGGLP